MLGSDGEAVREAKDIQPALRRARESGQGALIDVWVDPAVFSPGTMRRTMYKEISRRFCRAHDTRFRNRQ